MSVILITGCSSGFGMLAAARLAASGNIVYATMRNTDKQSDLINEAARRSGQVRVLQLDITNDDSIISAIHTIKEEQNRLDILINNAGYGIGGFFEDLTEEEIRDQIETNFFGTQKVIRHTLPMMRATAAGNNSRMQPKIINISSINGRVATPGLSAYTASKFALEGFSEGLYHELQPFGIDVVLIEPGSYLTKIFTDNGRRAKRAGAPDSPYTPYSLRFQDFVRRMVKTGEGIGNPEDVAALIEKVVNTSNPRLRYPIGGNVRMRIIVKHLIPFRLFSRFLLKMMYGKV